MDQLLYALCVFFFLAVLQQLISDRDICGYLKGRQDKAVYIPHIYVHNQNKWADSFLEANGFLGNVAH